MFISLTLKLKAWFTQEGDFMGNLSPKRELYRIFNQYIDQEYHGNYIIGIIYLTGSMDRLYHR